MTSLIFGFMFQSANLAASVKPKSARRPNAEAASGWSNEMDGDDDIG